MPRQQQLELHAGATEQGPCLEGPNEVKEIGRGEHEALRRQGVVARHESGDQTPRGAEVGHAWRLLFSRHLRDTTT